jgi:hypothetical protein
MSCHATWHGTSPTKIVSEILAILRSFTSNQQTPVPDIITTSHVNSCSSTRGNVRIFESRLLRLRFPLYVWERCCNPPRHLVILVRMDLRSPVAKSCLRMDLPSNAFARLLLKYNPNHVKTCDTAGMKQTKEEVTNIRLRSLIVPSGNNIYVCAG